MFPLIIGVINATPDSFSDGGRFARSSDAVAHGLRLLDEGADWLDVGGESTRPGASPVSAREELARVEPVIRELVRLRPGVVVSVDTSKASVAEAALAAGATVVNDMRAGADPDMFPVVSEWGASIVLTHMRGEPRTMQKNTRYRDLKAEVRDALIARRDAALVAGIPSHQILLDPGLGFGKAPKDNPTLIRGLRGFRTLGHKVIVGASRKRFVGELSGVSDPAARVHGSIGAALAAVVHGADGLRVHDVGATVAALRVFLACYGGPSKRQTTPASS